MYKIFAINVPKLVSGQFQFIDQYNFNITPDIDLAFNYEGELCNEKMKLLLIYGIPVIGGSRLAKHEQAVLMERLGINHPKSYFHRAHTRPFNCIEEFDSYVDIDEFVVKPILGARGIGVKKLTRLEYKKCIENQTSVGVVFKEEKEFLVSNGDLPHTDFIEDSFRFSSMLIQEPINVKREFRVLHFKQNTTLVYERVKKDKQFCGNLSHGSEPIMVDVSTFQHYITPMLSTFSKLLDNLNYPWLSIDLYVDDNDNVGIFEFQMEFAYAGFNYKEVRSAMEESLKYFIEKDKKIYFPF
jgi:hypothetical protein